MRTVDLFLFDLDGTLIDSKQDLASSVNLMLADVGRPPLHLATICAFVGDGVPTLVRRSLTATHPQNEVPDQELHQRGIALMHAHYAERMLETTGLYPGVTEMLGRLRSHRKQTGVVTSKEVHFTRLLLNHFGIEALFDCIIGGDTVQARKPDPEPVTAALAAVGAAAVSTVMVGDSENDILSGRGAGVITCGVTYGFRSAAELKKVSPDVLIDRLADLAIHFN